MGEGVVIPAPVGAGKTSFAEGFPDDQGVSISKKFQNEAYQGVWLEAKGSR